MQTEVVHYKNWGEVPDGLKSKTQWREQGFAIKRGAEPNAKIFNFKRGIWVFLYDETKCRPIRPPSEAQKAVLEKARLATRAKKMCEVCGYPESHVKWLKLIDEKKMCRDCQNDYIREHVEKRYYANQKLIADQFKKLIDENALIMETKTIEFNGNDQIVELAIIDARGDVIHHAHYSSSNPVSSDYGKLQSILQNKAVLIYNAAFSVPILEQSFICYRLAPIDFNTICVMEEMMSYYESPRHINLEEISGMMPTHDTLSNCRIILRLLLDTAT